MMTANKILAVSFIAMLAVSTANATVVTQSNIVGANGVTVSVPTSGTNKGKVQVSGPTVGNATLTVQRNGTTVDTFTANATSNKTINITDNDHITTATTGGSGNVVTAVSADANGALTVTKGITALQAADIAGKQDIQIGAAKSGSTASTDSGKAVVVDENGKIAMSSATLKAVATSGSYNDLSNKPTIPTVNNKTITIQKNGTQVDTFTTNASANKTINITMDKTDVGLGNVDNTSDADKPVSTATQTALDAKQNKLDATASTGNIKGTGSVTVTTPTTGTDAGKVVINSPTLATVATSGSYSDLSNKPTIPTVNNKTLTIKQNGGNAATFTANSASDVTVDITPAKVGAVATAQGSGNADKVLITNATTGDVETTTFVHTAGYNAQLTDKDSKIPSVLMVEDFVLNAVGDYVEKDQKSNNANKVMITNASGQVVPVAITNDGTGVVTGVSISNGTVTVSKSAIGAANVASGLVTGTAPIAVSRNSTSGVYTVSANAGAVANNTTATAGGGGALITGKTVYTEVRPAQTNGTGGTGYLGAPGSTTTATNLTNLDTAIKTIHPNTGEVKIPSGSETSSTLASIWVE